MKKRYLFMIATLIFSSIPLTKTDQVNASGDCKDVHFIFARGSGAELGEKDEQAWREAIETYIRRYKLKYTFYELGSTSQNGSIYQATAVDGSLRGINTLIETKITGGDSRTYGESVDSGIAELENYIKNVNVSCPGTKFVIGGYSQGAQVISKALTRLNPNKIVYAATFGDPKLYLPEGGKGGMVPVACFGRELSEYRANVSDCRAYEGILGSYKPYRPDSFYNKVGIWCNKSDIMCSSKYSLRDHLSYDSDSVYWHAAHVISQKLAEAFPAEMRDHSNINANQDSAFIIDTTGSMAGQIEKFKNEALRLAKETLDKGGHIALIEYRDLADPFEPVLHCDLTCSYEEFKNKINSLEAANGGDTEESFLSAAMFALDNLHWHSGATKSIIGLTDSGYIRPDRNGVTTKQVAARALQIDPVNFYIISTVPELYDEIAELTNGATFNLDDNLSIPTNYVLERPIAELALSEYYGEPGTTFTFDTSNSSASSVIDHYEWDLDFDGIFELSTNEPVAQKTYQNAVSGIMQVKVIDDNNLSSTMSATVNVEKSATPATISNLTAKKVDNNSYEIKFTPSINTSRTLVVLDDMILGYTPDSHFTISDIKSSSELRLIPISDQEIKGLAISTTIGEGEEQINTTNDYNLNIVMSDTDITTTKTTRTLKAPNSGSQ